MASIVEMSKAIKNNALGEIIVIIIQTQGIAPDFGGNQATSAL